MPASSKEESTKQFSESSRNSDSGFSYGLFLARHSFSIFVIAGLLGVGGCASTKVDPASASLAAMPPVTPARISQSGSANLLQKGDEVDVYILEDESFNGRYIVRESGDIILPKIGRLQVEGRSTREAERVLKARLEVDQLKTASVLLERSGVSAAASRAQSQEINRVTVYVTGFVLRPGKAVFPEVPGRPPTLLQAIAETGGFARFADQKSVAVLRRDGTGAATRTNIDVAAIQKGKANDIPLQGGDVVIVSEKTFGF